MRCSIKSKIRFVAFLMTFCIMASVYGYSFSASAVKYEAESDNSSYLIIDEVVIEDEIRVLKESDLPETMSLSEAKNQGHILRKREVETGLTTAVFENEDGTETMYMFAEPIKYTDSNGKIKDKSTNLTVSGTDLITIDNDINVKFPQSVNQGVSLSKGEFQITMMPNHASTTARTFIQDAKSGKGNSVLYPNAFGKGMHLKYTATLSGVKEDIIIDSYTDKNEFSFIVNTNGLYPVKNKNGSCTFFDPSTDKAEAEIMQIYCFDSAGKFAGGDISITELKQYQKYLITVIPDIEFLTSETTVYPITIDPTYLFSAQHAIKDTVIYSGESDRNYGDYNYLTVGYLNSEYKIGEMLVKFPVFNSYLSNIPADNINSAVYTMYTASGGNMSTIKAYEIPTSWSVWNEETVTWNDIYPVMIIPAKMASATVPANGVAATSFDLTALAKRWRNGTSDPNDGLLLCNNSESNASYARDFLSSEYGSNVNSTYTPRLEVNYTPHHIMSITGVNSTHRKTISHASQYTTVNLDAKLVVNAVQQPVDEYLVYTIEDDGGLNASVGATTGIVSLNTPYYNKPFDHAEGTVTVKIAYENDDSVCAYTNIVFTCPENPSFGVTMNSQIYDVGGRYISVGFDDSDDIQFDDAGYGAGQLEELIYDHYPGESLVRHLNCDFEYNGSDLYNGEEFWLEYTNYDDGVNALPQRLFELMSSSKVVCIVTHGSSSGLKMSKNENENALLTKEQIQSLHDGYFSYCDLVVYLACASGSSIGSNSNLLNATVEKGAKAAVGFSTTVLMPMHMAHRPMMLFIWSFRLSDRCAFRAVPVSPPRITAKTSMIIPVGIRIPLFYR